MVGGFQLFCDCFRVFDIFMMTPATFTLFYAVDFESFKTPSGV